MQTHWQNNYPGLSLETTQQGAEFIKINLDLQPFEAPQNEDVYISSSLDTEDFDLNFMSHHGSIFKDLVQIWLV